MRKINIVAFGICVIGLIIAGFPRYSTADVIYGCYDQLVGLLRIVPDSDPAHCTCFETPISWNSGPDILADAKAYTDSLVAAEANARQAGDVTLSTALNNEITRAQSAELVISDNLALEATARQGGDTAVLNAAKDYTDQQVATIAQGPPNGITKAVHGLYSYSGSIGTGFSIEHPNPVYNTTGSFRINFDTPFTATPICVVTLAYPTSGGQTCNVAVNEWYFNVNCFMTSIEGSPPVLTYRESDPNAFFFICVN